MWMRTGSILWMCRGTGGLGEGDAFSDFASPGEEFVYIDRRGCVMFGMLIPCRCTGWTHDLRLRCLLCVHRTL
jgi:hypothetical protein